MIHVLHFTIVEPIAGWPSCEKIVYESCTPNSYREFVRSQKRESGTVQLVMRGGLRWRVGTAGEWGTVGPGQALVYDAGTDSDLAYEADPNRGHLEFIYANLTGETMRLAIRGITNRAGHTVPVQGAKELIARWSARLISGIDNAHRCLSAVETCELAWSFLHPLARALAPNNRLAEDAMARLTEQWNTPPNLGDLAKSLQVSREHLSRVLRATCGQSPARWLRRYRISRATDLLLAGQSIKEVAETCGFCSAPHFINAFRRVHGCTPGQWVRQR